MEGEGRGGSEGVKGEGEGRGVGVEGGWRGGGMGFPAGPKQRDFVEAWQVAARLHKIKQL